MVPGYDFLQNEVLAMIDVGAPPRFALDLGAGSGIFLEKIMALFTNVQCLWIDYSDDFRDVAQRRLERFGSRVSFHLSRIEDPWQDELENAGMPEHEATYEINASLEISVPEFFGLVSHEVVPGHVTTFAYMQHLFVLGRVGFEGTVLTMNSRYSTLAEGIANNAILMAHGVTDPADLPEVDMQIGALLAELQDDAKNQASYLTYAEGLTQPEVEAVLRSDFLVTTERAEKLSGPWAGHPLLGRMYLPAYRAGTEKVAGLLRRHPPDVLQPALYCSRGVVDIATIDAVLE